MNNRPQVYRRLIPTYSIRQWAPFCHAVYVVTESLFDGSWGRDLPLFVGTRWTRRGARRLAEAELKIRAGTADTRQEGLINVEE